MFIFIVFMIVVSCKTTIIKTMNPTSDHLRLDDYDNYPTVFLNPDYKGMVQLEDSNQIIQLQNNVLEGNFILFSLIKKDDNCFEVIAWNSSDESFIGIGKIRSDVPICIYSRQYIPKKNPLKLYADPNLNSSCVSDTTYRTDALRVVDSYKKWLQVKLLINNKEYIGWLPPNMQCANVYSTCN